MRYHLKALWIAFVLFHANALVGLPPTEQAHGILVKFRNAAKATHARRDKLHVQMGTKLIYRPKRSPYDFVMPTSADKQRDLLALNKLCESYQSAPLVAECEISYDLIPRNSETAPAPGAGAAPAACRMTASTSIESLKDGTLSPFWAQEMIGADLVAFPRNASRMGVAVKIAMIDQDFGNQPAAMQKKLVTSLMPATEAGGTHGALSLSLITGPVPFTLQAPVEVTHLFEVRNTADYLHVLDLLEEAKVKPQILQISVGLGGKSNAVREALKRLSEKMVVVAAAGNNWPEEADRNEKEFQGILVGSLSPEGYSSRASAGGNVVRVAAPSDKFLQSTTDGTAPVTFGGTSGATALVTSTLAAAKSLVPDLTAAELRQILERTALPAPGAWTENAGIGSLNAVALLAVADRIRAQGLEGKQREKALASPPGQKLYKFEKEADMQLERATATLATAGTNCEKRKMAFQDLRRAFFLNPSGKAREQLVGMYREQGWTSNARYAEIQDKQALMAVLAADITSPQMNLRIGAARAAASLGMEGLDLVVKFAENRERSLASEGEAPVSTEMVLKALVRQMGAATRQALIEKMKAKDNSDLNELAGSLNP